jgi:hypothetical protein
MIRKFISAVAVVVALAAGFFAVNALGGTALNSAWLENVNATKRSIVDSTGVGVSISSYKLLNASAAVAWVHFYDIPCSAVTQGTTVPTWVDVLPSNSQNFVPFPAPVTASQELCVTSVTAYKGVTGSANGVALGIFIQ